MKKHLILALIVGFWTGWATAAPAAESPRERLLLDSNWRFHLGDPWPDAWHLENSGTGTGPASPQFPDTYWRAVNLPHDWGVELPFDASADGGHGFKAIGRNFPSNSVAWYRRSFDLPASDAGKRLWLVFDGVYRDATVWVNGWMVRHHEGGYNPFREDITDLAHLGGTNTISVRVDASQFEGWFYEGAGIYRHVWLEKTSPVAIAPDGVLVRPEFANNTPSPEAQILLQAEVVNALTNESLATVQFQIYSPDGSLVGQASGSAHVLGDSNQVVGLRTNLSNPVLWSPESPRLYQLRTTVSVGDKIVDEVETPFGLRTVGFDATNGFLLNGQHYEIYGTCNHQDHAGVGEAIPDALQDFRVKQLKAFGCNAIRTSHNPPTPELLDACDRLGLLVMDESRLMGSDSENMRKWEEQIRHDRNHPSVFIWSIGNEQFAVQDTPQAGRVALTMQNRAHELDPSRAVTYASPEDNVFRGINAVIEVRGWNYHYGAGMDRYHRQHPEQPNIGTEQASVVGTRGIYTNDHALGYVSAYDVVWPGWTTTAESWWSFFAPRPWLSGAFVWTGFDYRGEPTPYWWPCVNSHFGILDTCGFPKDVFYYYQSWWTTNPVLHLAPHWNWPGREGAEILVEAFSNCRDVELFLNGASLGRQTMATNSKLSWRVKYAPGTLSAKGYDAAGREIAQTAVETTGEPARITLRPDRSTIKADGEDVAVFTVAAVDAQGRIVPVAQNHLNFALTGAGKIIVVGNGDPSCHEPDVFVPSAPMREVEIPDWRWQLTNISRNREGAPEFGSNYDDAGWNSLNAKTSGGELTIKNPNTAAVYRAHLQLSEEDLQGVGVQLAFAGCDDEGWYFVNNQFMGETHDWQARPVFDAKKFLHPGDNIVAVAVNNVSGQGGLNPNVKAEILGQPISAQWSRSLFNGLAQVLVQSAREAGEIQLSATGEGLGPATAVVQAQPSAPRPSVP